MFGDDDVAVDACDVDECAGVGDNVGALIQDNFASVVFVVGVERFAGKAHCVQDVLE